MLRPSGRDVVAAVGGLSPASAFFEGAQEGAHALAADGDLDLHGHGSLLTLSRAEGLAGFAIDVLGDELGEVVAVVAEGAGAEGAVGADEDVVGEGEEEGGLALGGLAGVGCGRRKADAGRGGFGVRHSGGGAPGRVG